MFLETSALTGDGVQEIFLKCARTILSKIEQGFIKPDVTGSGVQTGDAPSAKDLSAAGAQKRNTQDKDSGCC
jgi:Ras-related protein Rab-4B